MYSIQTPPPNDDDLRWADQQLGDAATPDLISDLAWRRSAERQRDLLLDRECAACGAESREECRVGCLGEAKHLDEADS